MELVRGYLNQVQELLAVVPVACVEDVIHVLHRARLEGRRIYLLGNGGSASTASHFACDLAKNTRVAGLPDVRAIALTDNMAMMTAYANDEGYDQVFAQQLASFVQAGDVVIAISTSGNSPNVLRAVEQATAAGALTIGFTGFDGGMLGRLVKVWVNIPSCCVPQVEDVHLVLEHLICSALHQLAAPMLMPMEAQPATLVMAEVTARADK